MHFCSLPIAQRKLASISLPPDHVQVQALAWLSNFARQSEHVWLAFCQGPPHLKALIAHYKRIFGRDVEPVLAWDDDHDIATAEVRDPPWQGDASFRRRKIQAFAHRAYWVVFAHRGLRPGAAARAKTTGFKSCSSRPKRPATRANQHSVSKACAG